MKFNEAAFRALEHEMIQFASHCHKDQTYGGDKPYTFHLRAVRDVAYRFMPFLGYGSSIEVIVLACWGHDLAEDCGISKQELTDKFGEEVADLIIAVSKLDGKSRKDGALDYYKQIRVAGSSAVYLKLVDRIANVEAGGKTDMYKKEHLLFKASLYKENEFDILWNRLDQLFMEV